ncbi:MAG: EscU/YscU/HrcU family type III secretion system export apparatus switch protein [Catonella sp.]|uniref:EscU/YscU/HrcU family type III secretion system export apparatus switch protein n=1 Tax=Catonella sp. TaxID=2382125 RepID=UPI003F9F8EC7
MEKNKDYEIEKKKEIKTAVALGYDTESGEAPFVIAAGKGALAERIIEESMKNDIPQYEDEKLVKSLSKLEIGENVPPELYEVVAQVLLFVDKMDRLKFAVTEKRR